jgi:hypothetical protein
LKYNTIVEKDHSFNCPGVNVGMCRGTELDTKLNRFQKKKCDTARCLTGEVRKETIMKFYKVLAVRTLPYGSECRALNKRGIRRVGVAEIRFSDR